MLDLVDPMVLAAFPRVIGGISQFFIEESASLLELFNY